MIPRWSTRGDPLCGRKFERHLLDNETYRKQVNHILIDYCVLLVKCYFTMEYVATYNGQNWYGRITSLNYMAIWHGQIRTRYIMLTSGYRSAISEVHHSVNFHMQFILTASVGITPWNPGGTRNCSQLRLYTYLAVLPLECCYSLSSPEG